MDIPIVDFSEDDPPEVPEDEEPQEHAPFTALRALVGTLFRPRATFQRMREAKHAYWWVVLIVTLGMLTLFTVMKSNVQAARQAEMLARMEAAEEAEGSTTSTRGGGMGGGPGGGGPPGGGMGGGMGGGIGMALGGGGGADDAESAAGTTGGLSLALTLGSGVLGVLVGYLARGVLLFLLGLVLGGHATFKQVFRAGVWGTLPLAIRSLVQGMVVVVTGSIPISGLTGVFGTGGTGGAALLLTSLLGQIDIYLVWSLILLAVGMAATAKLSRLKAAVISLLSWLIMAGAMIGAGTLVSSLLGG